MKFSEIVQILEAATYSQTTKYGMSDEPVVDFQFPKSNKSHDRVEDYADAIASGGMSLNVPETPYKKTIMFGNIPIHVYFIFNRPDYETSAVLSDNDEPPIEKVLYFIKENPYHSDVTKMLSQSASALKNILRDKIDIIVPMPTSAKENTSKEYFNDHFSRILSDKFNANIASGLLKKRAGFIAHQVEPKFSRLEKTRGNVGITNPSSYESFFKEKVSILMVDEIFTNGFTFQAAAEKMIRRFGDKIDKLYAVALVGKSKMSGKEKSEYNAALDMFD